VNGTISQYRTMAYLKNSTVNLLNLHYGLHALVLNGAGVFYLVFLLKANVPTPMVFGTIALIVAGRFFIRPTILLLAPRWGLRPLLIFGTVFNAVQYLLLAEVQGVDLMLLALCLSSAIGDTFYWTTYHAYFAKLGDAEHRGHQIGAREAVASVAAIIGPLVGGWTLTVFGARAAFGAAAFVQVLSALPLLTTPDVPIAKTAPGAFRAALPGVLMFVADGWSATGFLFVWQVALFLSLGESFSAFGGALALAAFVGAVGGLVLGRHIDAGHGLRAVYPILLSLAAVTILRAASTQSAVMAVIANALGALVACFYIPTVMTAVYNQAKRSPCPLRFHLAAEGGWDIGCGSACLVAAILSALAVPLYVGILLTLLGIALLAVLLRRYYGSSAVSQQQAVLAE
jgi:MFS family permease